MVGRTEEKTIPPVKPSYKPLSKVMSQKRIRIVENSNQGLTQKKCCKDTEKCRNATGILQKLYELNGDTKRK